LKLIIGPPRKSSLKKAQAAASDESGDARLFTRNLAATLGERGVTFRMGEEVRKIESSGPHVRRLRGVGSDMRDRDVFDLEDRLAGLVLGPPVLVVEIVERLARHRRAVTFLAMGLVEFGALGEVAPLRRCFISLSSGCASSSEGARS